MTRGENLIAALAFHVASERNRSFPPPAEQPGTDCTHTHIRQLYLSRHTAHSELLLKVEHVAAGGSLQTSFSLSKVCSATGKSPRCFAVFALTHLCLPKNWRLKSLQFPSINSARFSFSLYFSLFCYEHKHTHTQMEILFHWQADGGRGKRTFLFIELRPCWMSEDGNAR